MGETSKKTTMAKEEIPPIKSSMTETADHSRKRDITLPLGNRNIRRKFHKLKKKRHFQDELAKSGITAETVEKAQEKAEHMVDEETKTALLEHLDVQRFLDVLNGLLTGQKKLVIESTPKTPGGNFQPAHAAYTHTFRVEDVDANG